MGLFPFNPPLIGDDFDHGKIMRQETQKNIILFFPLVSLYNHQKKGGTLFFSVRRAFPFKTDCQRGAAFVLPISVDLSSESKRESLGYVVADLAGSIGNEFE